MFSVKLVIIIISVTIILLLPAVLLLLLIIPALLLMLEENSCFPKDVNLIYQLINIFQQIDICSFLLRTIRLAWHECRTHTRHSDQNKNVLDSEE